MRAWFGIAAALALMTGQAAADSLTGRAETWRCNVDNTWCGWVGEHNQPPVGAQWAPILPLSSGGGGFDGVVSIAGPLKTRCAPGWTLVYAATAHGGTTTAKCAAVGDLRDPE